MHKPNMLYSFYLLLGICKIKQMGNATKEQLDSYIETVKKLREDNVITESEYTRITYRINTYRNWHYV